jgi:hypothetical protein
MEQTAENLPGSLSWMLERKTALYGGDSVVVVVGVVAVAAAAFILAGEAEAAIGHARLVDAGEVLGGGEQVAGTDGAAETVTESFSEIHTTRLEAVANDGCDGIISLTREALWGNVPDLNQDMVNSITNTFVKNVYEALLDGDRRALTDALGALYEKNGYFIPDHAHGVHNGKVDSVIIRPGDKIVINKDGWFLERVDDSETQLVDANGALQSVKQAPMSDTAVCGTTNCPPPAPAVTDTDSVGEAAVERAPEAPIVDCSFQPHIEVYYWGDVVQEVVRVERTYNAAGELIHEKEVSIPLNILDEAEIEMVGKTLPQGFEYEPDAGRFVRKIPVSRAYESLHSTSHTLTGGVGPYTREFAVLPSGVVLDRVIAPSGQVVYDNPYFSPRGSGFGRPTLPNGYSGYNQGGFVGAPIPHGTSPYPHAPTGGYFEPRGRGRLLPFVNGEVRFPIGGHGGYGSLTVRL